MNLRRAVAPLALLALPLLARAEEATPYPGTPPAPSNNLGWVMAANLVIWGGIALYIFWLHRRAASLDRGE